MLRYYPRIPKEYGNYIFKLTNGSIVYGYYSRFPYPHDEHIRVASPEEEAFYYVEHMKIIGYYEEEK